MPSPAAVPATVAKGSPRQADPGPLGDSPAAAKGRRILSTAFVRTGPDGYLTVELSGGRVLVLRDVIMRAGDFCGRHAAGDSASANYCGGYAEVAAARPGGAPPAALPDAAANPARPSRDAAKAR